MVEKETSMRAEEALAGAILVDSRCLKRIPVTLRGEEFQSEPCRNVYLGARALEKAGKTPDPVLIRKWVIEHGGNLEWSTVDQLMDITPTAEGAERYADAVHESTLRRKLLDAATQILTDQRMELTELLNRSADNIRSLQEQLDSSFLIPASSVPYEPPKWLIEPYIPRGKGTLIQADPGTGKTAFVCAIAAAVSTGRGFLNLRVETPGDVVMLSMEDDLGVLRGRIEADGGDLKRIHFMENAAHLHLNSPKIRQAIRACHAKLVIFDPFQAFLGAKVDLFRANETRPVLARLFEMCAQEDCACVIIAHLGKVTQGKSAVNQSLGSVDIPGAMRSILHIARSPDNPQELLALHIKSSNAARGKTIAFTIGEKGRVDFTGFSDVTMEDIAAGKQNNDKELQPLTEVLLSMMEKTGERFYCYEELRKAAQEKLGFLPFSDIRHFRQLVERSDFIKKLREQYGIQLEIGCKQGGARGIRLRRSVIPQGWQLRMNETNETNVTSQTIPENRPIPVQYGYYPVDDNEKMPWDE